MQRNKVAIIDDNKSFMTFMYKLLTREGYEVLPFSNTDEALNQIPQNDCHLVICDFMMPGKSGAEMAQDLKPFNTTTWILSSSNDPCKMKLAFKAGASKYRLKTDDFTYLLSEIDSFFSQREKESFERYLMPFSPIHAETHFEVTQKDDFYEITTKEEYAIGSLFAIGLAVEHELESFFSIEDIQLNDNYTFTHICKKVS